MWIFPPAPFLEDCLFPHSAACHSYWKSFDHICGGLFLDSLFYPIGLYVCLYHTVFITVTLQYILKSGHKRLPTCFFFEIFGVFFCCYLSFFLRFPMNFSVAFLFLKKKCHWDFAKGCIESIDCLSIMDILTILTFSIINMGAF